jgi:hypothetical protein
MKQVKYILVSRVQGILKIPFRTLLALSRKGSLPSITFNRKTPVFLRSEALNSLKALGVDIPTSRKKKRHFSEDDWELRRPRQRDDEDLEPTKANEG